MNSERLTRLTGVELARLITARELSPVEVVEGYLERIDRLDSRLNSYITLCREEALAAAREAERAVVRGDRLGPLHGLPLAVKDQFKTKGVLTTGGSTVLSDYIPGEDATVVARAKEAGAILLGKLNMTEFASGGRRSRFKYGQPRNPWDRERNAGGSSTGSGIAIAASLCAISLGEDTGGSIRGPASSNGIVGVRPTWARVSRHGLLPLCWSMDAAGPMTRTVEDAALVMNVIAGYDPKDPLTSRLSVPDYTEALSTDLHGVRLGLIGEFMEEDVDAEILRAVSAAVDRLEDLGAVVEDVSLPLLTDVGAAMAAITGSSGAFVLRKRLRSRPKDLGPSLRRRCLAASLIPSQVLEKAGRVRAVFRQEWRSLFQRLDALLSATSLVLPERIEYEGPLMARQQAQSRFAWRRNTTMAAALAGTPAMSIPCGFASNNLPIGLQIMADRFQERMMFRVAHAYEQSTMWHTRRPPL